jgi:RNA-splicing ligase RtcB
MADAIKHTQEICPDAVTSASWLDPNSFEGREYWDAMQIIREWTKNSHYTIHRLIAAKLKLTVHDEIWNEHNFVFQKTDGLFYHAKGATPAYSGYAHDDVGLTLIPMNMAEPIMITRGLDSANALGFSPHGAGRNLSRTEFLSRHSGVSEAELIAEQTKGIDARFFCGIPDVSELPGAYKNAALIRSQIVEFGLADIVDEVIPYGSIMAGNWSKNAPWKKFK